MEKGIYSELPERIDYLQHRDGSAEARLRRNIKEGQDDEGNIIWTATEVYIPHTMLSEEEIDARFNDYFVAEEPEATIADLTEAIDILTSIVLGEE
jgi:hypothetical protein